jgi:hypothetical protein
MQPKAFIQGRIWGNSEQALSEKLIKIAGAAMMRRLIIQFRFLGKIFPVLGLR